MKETGETPDPYARRMATAVALMSSATENPEDRDRMGEFETLDAHVVAVADHAEATAPKPVAAMLVRCGISQRIRGQFEAAHTNTTRALTIEEAVYGSDHHQVAITLGNLGIIQQLLGRLEEAEATQQRALAIFEAVYGSDHHQVASTLGNLGIIQQQLGRLEEARATVQRAHIIFLRTFGADHDFTRQAERLLAEYG